ncbi:MAG: DUF433 domain-containing protein [Blastocatellia bacterium]|nr:DUF433 domain-containing protein [Blastocatellia bacterium]
MSTLETTIDVPLTVTEYGSIRIKGSRVSLDSIIYNYKLGATAEHIAYSFPSLSLADIHLAIAYYLTHREEVEEYLRQQEAEEDAIRQQIESDPEYQKRKTEFRERILARWAARQKEANPVTSE